jgi:hypothetical protein
MGAFLINQPKCVFIHIPKVAGTTVRNGIFKGDYQGPVFKTIPKEWEEYFSFTFVRNPYDRLVSAWKMFSNGMENSKWAFNNKPPMSGISFIDFLKLAVDDTIDFHSRDTIESVLRHHTLPQVHSYHCFEYADFVGKFEDLEEDFKFIANKIGLNNYNLTHLNKTKRKNYKEYYDEETFNIVSKHYKSDIETFDYSF